MKFLSINVRLTLFIIGSVVFFSCRNEQVNNDEASPNPVNSPSSVSLNAAQLKNAGITTTTIERKKMGSLIKLKGKTEVGPQNLQTVSVPMAGIVKNMRWMPGMKINQGQVVTVLEDYSFIQLQQEYLQAKSALYFAQKEYDRQVNLYKTQSGSEKAMLQAEEIMRNRNIEVSGLKEKLKLININAAQLTTENVSSKINLYAPTSGYVSDVMVNAGKHVQSSDPLLNIIGNQQPHVVLKVFENDLMSVMEGQLVTIATAGNPEKKYRGKITYTGKNLSSDGYSEVIANFEDGKTPLLPGQYVAAEIESKAAERWAVPQESIVSFEGKDYIFIETKDKKYEMKEIKAGLKEVGHTEIINYQGLEGLKVVTKGSYTLLMKMKNKEE